MVQNNVAPPSKRTSKLLGQPAPLVLKVEGTERDGQIIRVHSPKCLVGSASDCQLRLVAADVLPKHCVIYRGPSGVVVKSWTRDTRVNGNTISEAWLRIGDRLSLGSLSFEVLADLANGTLPEAAQPEEVDRAIRQQRRHAHRRIRNLLDVVRSQKTSFDTLQAKFDEAQRLVDSLLAREEVPADNPVDMEAELRSVRAEHRKRNNRRVRGLVRHVRQLIDGNNQLQTQLREQLEVKQNQLDQIRQELTKTADTSEVERAQRSRLEAELRETADTVGHLKEQTVELESRAERLHQCWQSARQNGRVRVRSILSHLRAVRDQLPPTEDEQATPSDGSPSRLTEMRLAYDDAYRELQENRTSLKATESELAWSQQELDQRQQQVTELTSRIGELEHQLAFAHKQQEEASLAVEASSENAPLDPAQQEELTQLHAQLADQMQLADELKLQLEELHEKNQLLQQSVKERSADEQDLRAQLEEAHRQAAMWREQLEEDRRLANLRSDAESGDENARGEDDPENPSAIDRLRSMGILRDTPEYEEEEEEYPETDSLDEETPYQESDDVSDEASQPSNDSVRESQMEPASPSQGSTGLSSFPNFQFPEDEPERDEEQADAESSQGSPTAHQEEHHDDDESIDAYMQNLLQRMRTKQTGGHEPEPVKVAPPKPEVKPEPAPEPEQVTPITHEEFLPSRNAPEQTSDIKKLRELANQTAKAAIDSATVNRWERLCRSKLVVSVLALGAGFTMHYLSPGYMSIGFAGACLAYVVTVFWWLQSAVIYQHVKNHRKERMEKRFQDEILTPHGIAAQQGHSENE